MQAEKIIKVNPNVLVQWVYDDTNLISEDYRVLTPDGSYVTSFGYVQANLTNGIPSVTQNLTKNQLFRLDAIANRYGKVDTVKYPFLHIQDFPAPAPMRFDTVRIFFPINYTFEDKVGIFVRIYTYDFQNIQTVDLANFYFDKTDTTMTNLIDLASPPINFQEKLWGKYIQLQIPSVFEVSAQRTNGVPTPGSINSNIGGGIGTIGLSQTAPIFVDFSFIELSETVLGTTTFILSQPYTASVPQTPDFQNVSVNITESKNGDFFEINGIYNNSNEDFAAYIESLNSIGQSHYLIYTVTLFEENVPTNTVDYVVNDDYSKIIIHRPVIVSSNTTAAIQVEMKIINAVDNSQVSKMATLGLLREQISKYSAYLTRINVKNVFKPKIYNVRGDRPTDYGQTPLGGIQKVIQKVDVPFPVMYDSEFVVAKNLTENTKDRRFFGFGKMKLKVHPFDNIIKFVIAKEVKNGVAQPFDMTQASDIRLVFKSAKEVVECPMYFDSGEIDLFRGVLVFRMTEKQSDSVKKIYEGGDTLFYIVMVSGNGIKTVVYSSAFVPIDSKEYQSVIVNQANLEDSVRPFNILSNIIKPLAANINVGIAPVNLSIKPNAGPAIKISPK